MNSALAADAFRSAFRVAPEVARQVRPDGLGIFGWKTPEFEGFELPQCDELVVALHRGGSRRVRQVTHEGLSSTRSIPGLITLLPPGQPAKFRTHGSVGVVTLHVPTSATDSTQLLGLAHAAKPCFAVRDPYVSAAMETLVRGAQAAMPPDYLLKVADALICHLEQWAHQIASGDALDLPDADHVVGRLPLRQLLEHIDTHLHLKLSLDELAAHCGLKRAQFALAFQVATGWTPHRHILRRRIQAARRMLAHSGHDLAFIAQETGFSSQSHFTAQFRSFTGCTPRRFRESH